MVEAFAIRLKRSFKGKNALKHILTSTAISWGILCYVFSDLLIDHSISFIRFVDFELNFTAVTTVVMSVLHGGFPLWNPFDQMPLAYFYLVGGLFNYSNLATAGLFLTLSNFFALDGHAFHAIYSVVFFIPGSIVRTAGAYCLLKRFCKTPAVLLFSTVLCTTLLSGATYFGLNTSCFYSFFPIMTHFILRFVDDLDLDDLLLAFLTFTACVVFDPWIGVGYFYQGLHFLILSSFLWLALFNSAKLKSSLRHLFAHGLTRKQWLKIAGALLIWGVVILPWAFMFRTIQGDYFLAPNSRMENMFSITEYFKRAIYFAPQSEFLWRTLDFTNNNWPLSWLFLGYFTAFLSCVGLIFNRDNRKYIFLLTIILLIMLNSARDSFSWNAPAHWLNAITNPFKFLTRSMHMTSAFLIPYVILPIAAMGAQAIANLIGRRRETLNYVKLLAVTFIMSVWICIIWKSLTHEAKIYLATSISAGILLLVIAMSGMRKVYASVAVSVLAAALFLSDVHAYRKYYRPVAEATAVMPHNISGLDSFNPVNVDFVNPKILPWRGTYQGQPIGQVSPYLQTNAIGMQGLIFRSTELSKYNEPPHLYHPRVAAYKELINSTMQTYLQRDSRLIRFVEFATPGGPGVLENLLQRGLDKQVIEVVNFPEASSLLPNATVNSIDPLPESATEPREGVLQTIKFNIHEAENVGGSSFKTLIWRLPPDFPDFISSSVFEPDGANLAAHVGTTDLQEVQGGLIRPFQFDVQNVGTGKIAITLPSDYVGGDLQLTYLKRGASPDNTGVIGVTKNEMDRFGFTFKAPKSGWLVLHYPFDEKWRITIDGERKTFYQVNRAFVGLPISSGQHKILIEYWPDTYLRGLMAFSAVASVLIIFLVFGNEIRRMNRLSSLISDTE